MPSGTAYQADPIHTTGDFRIEFWANYLSGRHGFDDQGKPSTIYLFIAGGAHDTIRAIGFDGSIREL